MPGTCSSGARVRERELDVAVELGEALLAGQLGLAWAEQARASWAGSSRFLARS